MTIQEIPKNELFTIEWTDGETWVMMSKESDINRIPKLLRFNVPSYPGKIFMDETGLHYTFFEDPDKRCFIRSSTKYEEEQYYMPETGEIVEDTDSFKELELYVIDELINFLP